MPAGLGSLRLSFSEWVETLAEMSVNVNGCGYVDCLCPRELLREIDSALLLMFSSSKHWI